MVDPGFSYLYEKSPEPGSSSSHGRRAHAASGSPAASAPSRLKLASGAAPSSAPSSGGPAASPNTAGSSGDGGGEQPAEPGDMPVGTARSARWEAALRNVEEARAELNALARLVDDAVYLDEDAYSQVQPKVAYIKTIQAQQARIASLSAENQELHQRLTSTERKRRQSDLQVQDVTQELENNSAVFKLHYSELIAKDEEIKRLKAVIEGLSSGRQTN